jgi:CheY-like chemotaxis protein
LILFFSTKGIKEGTGLGLAVTHGIVKSHHGIITVDSKLEKGSSFTIYLPATSTDTTLTQEHDEKNIPGGDEHVLVVDDEHAILSIRERLLLGLGYKVTTFTSSIEALSSFREDPFQYDLLLTDMTMPKMDGKELTKKLLDVRPNMPVIMCTGHSALINKKETKEYGIYALLYKPVKPAMLARTIRQVLDRPTGVLEPDQNI